MIILLKNLECYCPRHIGKKDILISNSKIYKIKTNIDCMNFEYFEKIIDCEGLTAFPAIIDQHVHITGGGGENGFSSHIPEIAFQDIVNAGVATVVGLLGADSCTRNLESLYAKAKSLDCEGLNSYIYTGSYLVPPITFTGDIIKDLVLIDKVLGVGEIALSDHRSSHPDKSELLKVASDTYLGGLLSGKAGVIHLHMGDGKEGLEPLISIINESNIPIEQFVPTHVNRNLMLFNQAIDFCENGGNIDLTSGEKVGITIYDAIKRLISSGVNLQNVTISSDSNGSIPNGGVSRIDSLFKDMVSCIKDNSISTDDAISLVTENVAKRLKLYPQKGTLSEGSDADILITDRELNIKKLFCMGKSLLDID